MKAKFVFPRWAPAAAVFSAGAFSYANTLGFSNFIWDDKYGILNNPLLRGWATLPRLLSVGYWEGSLGFGAHDQLYRPVAMLAFFLVHQIAGFNVWPYHFLNLLIHSLNAVLVLRLLRRYYSDAVAVSAALLFAVLPIHSEAVAYISELPEILALTWLLCAWPELEFPAAPNVRGLGLFCLAMLTKEQAVMFLPILALHDWVFHGNPFWQGKRSKTFLAMAFCAAGYFAVRIVVLGKPLHVGVDYFAGVSLVSKLLTLSRFAVVNMAWPMMTGLGLRHEFYRPLIPDASPGSVAAWLCWIGWIVALAEACRRTILRRRGRRISFWLLAAFLYFLPASNLIVPINVIGAQRHLYFPSLAFCVAAGQALELIASWRAAALVVLCAWYAGHALAANQVWADEKIFYETGVRENPRSSEVWAGYGAYLAEAGRSSEAETALEQAIALDPRLPAPYFNLGKLRWEQGDFQHAESLFQKAIAREPSDPDTWLFLANAAEKQGRLPEAAERCLKAIELEPWNPDAHFDLARLLMLSGRKAEAAREFREYLRLNPSAGDAVQIASLIRHLESEERP